MTGASTPKPAPASPPSAPADAADHLGDPPAQTAGLWNIANLLTMTRLVLVPGFVLLLVHGDGHDPVWRSIAWAAFAVAMITDLFDGELARRYGLVTDFGKIADPIADKAIMGAALIGLSGLGDLPWWVTTVILVRELGITLLRFWVIRHGVIPASRGGKLKTLTQGVAVGMYILILTGPLATTRALLMAIAVLLTVGTGLDYIRQAVVLRRAGLAAEARERERARAVGETAAPVAASAQAPTSAVAAASAPARVPTGATRAVVGASSAEPVERAESGPAGLGGSAGPGDPAGLGGLGDPAEPVDAGSASAAERERHPGA